MSHGTPGMPSGALVLTARPEDVLVHMDPLLLTPDERRRSAALQHPGDREARDAAHLLVRRCAALLTGLAPETLQVVQRCPGCGSTDHGKPSLVGRPEVHLSLAHARGAVAAAAGRRPVGVDVERARAVDVEVARSSLVLSAAEFGRVRSAADPSTAFLRHWVRKECLVKTGLATLDGLGRIEIDPGVDDAEARRTLSRYGPLHLVDWVDDDLDAVYAAAGFEPPVVQAFPGDRPSARPAARA